VISSVSQRAIPFACATLLALSIAPALAADPTPSPSATPISEIGRVSTSDRHDEPIDRTTRTTYVVDQTHIEARGDRTVAQALSGVPGVTLFNYGAFGSQTTVMMRGATTSSVLVLLDGVPISPASSEEIDLGSLSTTGIRRIEVVQGGASTLYGTSAVGGIINIITSIPRGTYLEVADGSLGERDLRVGAGNGRLGVSFERHVATNSYDFPAMFSPASGVTPGGTRTNADAQQSAVRLSYDINLAKNITARFRLGSDDLKIGVPGSLQFGPTVDARQNLSRDDGHLDITASGAQHATTLTFGVFKQRLAFADPNAPPESDTIDGRTQLSLRHVISSEQWTFNGGVDFARDSALITNTELFDVNFNPIGFLTFGEVQSEAAAYIQEQYAGPSGLRASAGLRAERDAPLGGVVAPSLGLSIPLGNVRLLANGGGSFRVPTIVDRFFPGFSNPNLVPERSSDGDITLRDDGLLGGASLGWFMREVNNLIALDPAFTPQNIAHASIRGLQGVIRTKPMNGVVANLSITDTYRALNLTPGADATRLAFTPVMTATLGAEHPIGTGRFGFGVQANIFGPHIEGTAVNPDGQTVADAWLRERIAKEAVLSLRVRNLGYERYQPFLGYPATGRTFELELATR
jgi:vitamin B12 transporter